MGIFFLIFLIITAFASKLEDENGIANSTIVQPPQPAVEARNNEFKPGVVVIVGMLTTLFAMTFLLLLYVRHCKRGSFYGDISRDDAPSRRNSGVNRKIIDSLPMFRFSSLRGQKDGLECAVCLTKFEPDEVLRLLPKCKHAFHVECVDTWLDAHSTCPLCRYRVVAEDVLLVDSKSLYNHCDQITPRSSDQGKENGFTNPRVSGRHSSAGERGGSLEIIVENPEEDFRERVSLDSCNSRRKTGSLNLRSKNGNEPEKDGQLSGNLGNRSKSSRKDGQLPVQGDKHRLEHRIILSGVAEDQEEERRRWSDVQAADLLFLRSEMLLGGGDEEGGSGRGIINGRSVSEITGVSRYRSNDGGRERGEEGVVKRWLAWVSQSKQETPVNSAPSASSSSSSIVN